MPLTHREKNEKTLVAIVVIEFERRRVAVRSFVRSSRCLRWLAGGAALRSVFVASGAACTHLRTHIAGGGRAPPPCSDYTLIFRRRADDDRRGVRARARARALSSTRGSAAAAEHCGACAKPTTTLRHHPTTRRPASQPVSERAIGLASSTAHVG